MFLLLLFILVPVIEKREEHVAALISVHNTSPFPLKNLQLSVESKVIILENDDLEGNRWFHRIPCVSIELDYKLDNQTNLI